MLLDKYFADLQDTARPLTSAALTRLSGLVAEERAQLASLWNGLPAERRRQIVSRMVDLAEDNVELDFASVFCHAMTDPDPAVRERAVSGLWESDDRTHILKLADRLAADTSAEVRAAAASVLGHFAELAVDGKLVTRDATRVHDALLRALSGNDEPPLVRRRALEAIAPFNAPEVHAWVRWAYAHTEPLLRQSALFAMGRSGNDAWLPVVLAELRSKVPGMRFEAANAARELAEPSAVPSLIELLTDADPEVQVAAIHALGAIGGATAKKVLRRCTAEDQDDVVREAARGALESMDDPDGPPDLFAPGRS